MIPVSSQHHSFDIAIAAKFGVESAILIHHFQHWIRINRFRNKNIIDGRCWTYQTRKDIQANFPYFTYEEVKYLCEKLVERGILMTGNYNKSHIDRTLWYAFVDEKAFGVDEDFSKNVYEKGKVPNGWGNFPNAKGKSPSPIPDPITDTKTDIEILSSSQAPPGDQKTPGAQSVALAQEFQCALKDSHGNDAPVLNQDKAAKIFELMLRIDKREPSVIRKVMNWAVHDSFWRSNILSPEKLRKKFLQLKIKMETPINTPKNKKQEREWNPKQTQEILPVCDLAKQLFPD